VCRVGVEPTIPYSVSNRNQLADFTTQTIKGCSRNSCSHCESIVVLPTSPVNPGRLYHLSTDTYISKKTCLWHPATQGVPPFASGIRNPSQQEPTNVRLSFIFCRANLRCYWSLPQIVQAIYAVFGDSSEKHTLPYVG